MGKKSEFSDSERQRIELKFECLRRSNKYKKAYTYQKQHEEKKSFEELWSILYPRWFHYPLLDPKVSLDEYKKEKGKKYAVWLERILGGLITDDSLCPQPIKIESSELRKFLAWKRRRFKAIINVKKGKVKMRRFPKGEKAYKELDSQLVERELRNVKIVVDMYDCDLTQFRKRMDLLYKELDPLVRRFLYKTQEKKNKRITAQNKATLDYFKTYDKKQTMSYRKMSDDQNQQRKFKEHVKITRALIEKEQWHYI
jgi:hypothetical protein